MELAKNIFFNTDKLVGNTTVKISYTGNLFQGNSEEVFIHYGFGLQWENVQEKQMEKTELGFQAEIELDDNESLNFCFRDNNDVWDNNENQNYIFPIEHIENALVVQEEVNALPTTRRLRKSYIWSKKIRIAIYKIITYIPKIISGNYKRKIGATNGVAE